MTDESKITALGLSSRAERILQEAGIKTVGSLRQMSDEDLLELKGFGQTCLDEVHEALVPPATPTVVSPPEGMPESTVAPTAPVAPVVAVAPSPVSACEKCDNCAFSRWVGSRLECRWGPPTVRFAQFSTGKVESPGYWPMVPEHEWCGQHRPRKEQ